MKRRTKIILASTLTMLALTGLAAWVTLRDPWEQHLWAGTTAKLRSMDAAKLLNSDLEKEQGFPPIVNAGDVLKVIDDPWTGDRFRPVRVRAESGDSKGAEGTVGRMFLQSNQWWIP